MRPPIECAVTRAPCGAGAHDATIVAMRRRVAALRDKAAACRPRSAAAKAARAELRVAVEALALVERRTAPPTRHHARVETR